PAHCTSVGKALLATLEPARLDELYADVSLVPSTDRSIRTVEQLRIALEVVRQQGYAQSDGEGEEGVSSVAAAIRDSNGSGVAAISVAAPTQRFSTLRRIEVAHAVIETAYQIAADLAL